MYHRARTQHSFRGFSAMFQVLSCIFTLGFMKHLQSPLVSFPLFCTLYWSGFHLLPGTKKSLPSHCTIFGSPLAAFIRAGPGAGSRGSVYSSEALNRWIVTTRSLASKRTPWLWLDRRRSHCWALAEQSCGWETDTEASLSLRHGVSTSLPPAEWPLPLTLAGRRGGHLDSGQVNSQSITPPGPGRLEWRRATGETKG